jgi:ADP-ribosyl-[dinitrogen reductase] hydrolase
MIQEGAIGDAYGAGFEFAARNVIEKFNTLEKYIPHPLFESIFKKYTDDTQMTIAIIELILSNKEWTSLNVANSFVETFKRDPREGYARGFQAFLTEISNGQELIDKIINKSERNGAAMRAYPLGVFKNIEEVKEKTKIQAEVTHATDKAVISAQAIAIISHYFIHNLGKKEDLVNFVRNETGRDWIGEWHDEVQINGIETVEAVLSILKNGTHLSKMLLDSVNLGGDVDTVASIALAIGSISNQYENDIPTVLYDELENNKYGKDYLVKLDSEWLKFIDKQRQN